MKRLSARSTQLQIERQIEPLDRGLVGMRQVYTVPQRYRGALVTGPHWLFSQVQVVRGVANFVSNNSVVATPRDFTLFIPPFTIVRFDWARCEVSSDGLLGDHGLESGTQAFICPAVPAARATSAADVAAALRLPRTLVSSTHPTSAASRAKTLLDANYAAPLSMAEVAAQCSLSPSALSRAFHRQYGLTAIEYRHRVQIMAAILLLSRGERIAATAFDVGFNDLSRFYKQFAKYTRVPPSSYRCDP